MVWNVTCNGGDIGRNATHGGRISTEINFVTLIHVPPGHPETMKRPAGGVPGISGAQLVKSYRNSIKIGITKEMVYFFVEK